MRWSGWKEDVIGCFWIEALRESEGGKEGEAADNLRSHEAPQDFHPPHPRGRAGGWSLSQLTRIRRWMSPSRSTTTPWTKPNVSVSRSSFFGFAFSCLSYRVFSPAPKLSTDDFSDTSRPVRGSFLLSLVVVSFRHRPVRSCSLTGDADRCGPRDIDHCYAVCTYPHV